jgi:predicted lysophospholipase L1 biosynthesis ABC-type transport system permease subunit
MLNESASRHFFGHRDPVGTLVKLNDHPYRVIGVVRDMKQTDLRSSAGRFIYIPLRQPYDRNFEMTLSIRTAGDPQALMRTVERHVRGLGADFLMTRTITLEQQVDESLTGERALSSLAAAFGVLALVLSAVGLYGVLAYSVTRRTSEIGIRMALGARPRQVAGAILRQTMRMVAIGFAFGIPASLMVSRAAAHLLYGVGSTDIATLAGTAVLLVAVVLLASYLPAHRAGKIDPLTALRHH